MKQYLLLTGHYRYQLCDGHVYELLEDDGNVLVVRNHLGLEQKVFDFSIVARYNELSAAKKAVRKLNALWKNLEKQQRRCLFEQKEIIKEK